MYSLTQMNSSDLLLICILIFVGGFFASIGTLLTAVFIHFVINYFLEVTLFRKILSLLIILFSTFVSSIVGFVAFIGFAADENAGEIVPYYFTISLGVSLINTSLFYFINSPYAR